MRYEIGFGIGFDRDNQRIDPLHAQECLKIILAEAAGIFGGCNLVHGQGVWINPAGDLVVEESCTLTVDVLSHRGGSEFTVAERQAVDALAQRIGKVLNQAAVRVMHLVGAGTEYSVVI